MIQLSSGGANRQQASSIVDQWGDAKTAIGKTIFFHVGTVKTGSTAIQRALWENRKDLESMGLHYLSVSSPRLDLPRYTNADFLLDPNTDFLHVLKVLDATPQKQIVISDEALWGRPHLLLHPVFDGYRKVVIIYARNPAEIITSWAAENAEPYNALPEFKAEAPRTTKLGPLAIDESLMLYAEFYRGIFDRFLSVLTDFERLGGRVIVRPYELRELLDGDVVKDFFSIFNLDAAHLGLSCQGTESLRTNVSHSRKFCDLSVILWEILSAAGEETTYTYQLVRDIQQDCKSGDDRSTLDTLDDKIVRVLSDECFYILEKLCRWLPNDTLLFKSPYPRSMGLIRAPYSPVSRREVELLLELHRLRSGWCNSNCQ